MYSMWDVVTIKPIANATKYYHAKLHKRVIAFIICSSHSVNCFKRTVIDNKKVAF